MKLQHKLMAAAVAASPAVAFAQEAQPDTSNALTYIAAGVATLVAVWGGKYIIHGVIFLGSKIGTVVGRG